MRVETLARPLSIDRLSDGGAYVVRKLTAVRSNVFFRIACVDALYIKIPTREGLDEYRKVVKAGPPPTVDVRLACEAERFERIAHAVETHPNLAALKFRDPELFHYLVIHKMQHERLQAAASISVPDARFGAIRTGRLFRRLEPALFQARVPGTTLWDMFDFDASRIKSEWRQSLPIIASRLTPLLDSALAEHIDWNIRNFVFDAPSARLFYVDMKPTTFVPRYSNEHNIEGIQRYFI